MKTKILFTIANVEDLNLIKGESSTNMESILAQLANGLQKYLANKEKYISNPTIKVKTIYGTYLMFEIAEHYRIYTDVINKFELTFEGFYHE